MASGCPSMSVARANDAYSNVTELLLQRYQDSPKDDLDRLLKCWGHLNCGDCHRSDGFCGWCPISYTCLPLPNDTLSRAFPLLSPMRHKSICALGSERFELRTAGLGCQVSTITFLTFIFTILSALFGILVLGIISRCVKGIVVSMRARNSGYVVYPNEEEQWTDDLWTRRGEGWGRWWRRMNGDQKEFEVEEVDDGSPRKTGRNWWGGRKGGQIDVHGEETRPLLNSN